MNILFNILVWAALVRSAIIIIIVLRSYAFEKKGAGNKIFMYAFIIPDLFIIGLLLRYVITGSF